MREYNLPEPEFFDERGFFIVKLYKYKENEDNKKLKNYDKEEETIPTKCSFTLNLQKLEFNIISIEKFVKEKEIKKDNYNTNY